MFNSSNFLNILKHLKYWLNLLISKQNVGASFQKEKKKKMI